MDELRQFPALRKTDGGEILADGLGEDLGRGDRGPGRRIQEEIMPPRPGRTALRQNLHLQISELADEVLGRGDGGRRHQKLGRGAVMRTNAPQTPEYLGHMAAQNAPIGVDFVDDHEAQAAEKLGPGVVIRQKPQVQHVRVADEDVGRFGFQDLALGRGRVAVIDGCGEERGGQGRVQFPECFELVLFQGL